MMSFFFKRMTFPYFSSPFLSRVFLLPTTIHTRLLMGVGVFQRVSASIFAVFMITKHNLCFTSIWHHKNIVKFINGFGRIITKIR